MKTAILNTNQFNISEAIFSDFESLDQSVFKNEALSPVKMNLNSKLILVSAFLLLIVTVFGLFAFQQLLKDVYLNPIYHPLNYGIYIVACGWLVFNAGISIYKLYLYLKFKPVASVANILSPISTSLTSTLQSFTFKSNDFVTSIENYLSPVFVKANTHISTSKIAILENFSMYREQNNIMNYFFNIHNTSLKHIKTNIRINEILDQALKRLDMNLVLLTKKYNRNLDYST